MKSGRRYKNAVYEQFARITKAVASPKRLELLDLLCQGERTVEELAKQAEISVANASQHLQVLRVARLVETERHGVFIVYRLAGQRVCDFFQTIKTLAEQHLAEIEQITRQYLQNQPDLESVDRETLRERVRTGAVTVLDVRPAEEYRAGHIPGALCVPIERLDQYLQSLPTEQEIVAYCRGPYCVLAVEAVSKLKGKGFLAVRMEDGVQEWRAQGLPVTIGEEP